MKNLLILLTWLLIVAACSPGAAPDSPTTSETPGLPPSYAPQAGDSELERGPVYLDSADVLTMESYPLQFAVVLTGNLPTPCHALRVVIGDPDDNNRIALGVYSVVDPNAVCAGVLEPFEQNVYLGSFPTGHYTLWVDEAQVAEFDA